MRRLPILYSLLLLITPLSATPNLHVCALANQETHLLGHFLDSCYRHGIDVDILGWDKLYYANGWGMKLIEHYINHLPDEDLVLVVDSFDLFFLAGKETIIEKFLELETPFYISAEKWCYPNPELKELYPPSHTDYRFLNSGTYMGFVKDVKQVFRELPHPLGPYQEDQLILTQFYLKHPEKCHLDRDCALAQTLFAVDRSELIIDPISISVTNLATGTMPCIIHGNARASLLEVVYDELIDQNPYCPPIERPKMVPFDDLGLLLNLLEKEPENLFLQLDLADLYFAAKEYAKGKILYQSILESFSLDAENSYWCLYQLARIEEELGSNEEKVIAGYRKAFIANPSHAEPLYRIGKWYNSHSRYVEGASVLLEAMKIPSKRFETYDEDWIYLWGIPSETALALYWSQRHKEAEKICLALLEKPRLPEYIKSWTLDMQQWIKKGK